MNTTVFAKNFVVNVKFQNSGRKTLSFFRCPCLYLHCVTPFTSLRDSSTLEPIIDPLLLQEQTVYRHDRSTVDQVTLLTKDMEDSLSAKKAGAVFVDLPAVYDTVWRGLQTFLSECRIS